MQGQGTLLLGRVYSCWRWVPRCFVLLLGKGALLQGQDALLQGAGNIRSPKWGCFKLATYTLPHGGLQRGGSSKWQHSPSKREELQWARVDASARRDTCGADGPECLFPPQTPPAIHPGEVAIPPTTEIMYNRGRGGLHLII